VAETGLKEVSSSVKIHMITGDQDLLFRLVQTGMAEAVPRSMNASEIDFQFLKSGLDRLPALIPVQPRFNDQIPLGQKDHLRVEKLEWTGVQRHYESAEAFQSFHE
jgi:hypothetical protein